MCAGTCTVYYFFQYLLFGKAEALVFHVCNFCTLQCPLRAWGFILVPHVGLDCQGTSHMAQNGLTHVKMLKFCLGNLSLVWIPFARIWPQVAHNMTPPTSRGEHSHKCHICQNLRPEKVIPMHRIFLIICDQKSPEVVE